jgi:hypothetical protein
LLLLLLLLLLQLLLDKAQHMQRQQCHSPFCPHTAAGVAVVASNFQCVQSNTTTSPLPHAAAAVAAAAAAVAAAAFSLQHMQT